MSNRISQVKAAAVAKTVNPINHMFKKSQMLELFLFKIIQIQSMIKTK